MVFCSQVSAAGKYRSTSGTPVVPDHCSPSPSQDGSNSRVVTLTDDRVPADDCAIAMETDSPAACDIPAYLTYVPKVKRHQR